MRLVFAGTPEVAAIALEKLAQVHEIALVITRPDAPLGRKRVITPSPVAVVAERLSVPVLKSKSIESPELARISSQQADLGIVVAYGALLGPEVLEQMDWWNLHFSLLPQWRGSTPLQHSIWHGTGQGLTVFKLDAGMDTGEIVGAESMAYAADSTAADLLPQLAVRGGDLLLRLLEADTIPFAQVGQPSLAPKIGRTDARLDFADKAEVNARKVMALNPEPMAWAEHRGEPLRILRAKAVGNVDWSALEQSEAPLGRVQISSEKVLVTCGAGTRLQLVEVQPSGKRVMSGIEWFRGLQGSVDLD